MLKRFNNFKINEDLEGPEDLITDLPDTKNDNMVTLYRLTAHPVVDLSDPGEFYVDSVENISVDLLDKPNGDLFLITVVTDESNIDEIGSEKETAIHDNESIVMVKDSTRCEIVSVVPYEAS